MILFLLAGLGMGIHSAGVEIRKFESLAAQEIRSNLQGDSAKVSVSSRMTAGMGGAWGDFARVTIDASDFRAEGLPLWVEPGRSQYGKVRELVIRLRDFNLAGLDVARLEATIPDCRFDLGLALSAKKIRLSRSGEGSGRVEVTHDALERFIVRKFAEVKRVEVKLGGDRIMVAGYGEFLLVKTEFLVVANLRARNGVQLYLEDAKIYFDGVTPDAESSRILLDTLNPVVDLDKDLRLHGAVTFVGVRLSDNRLLATCTTRIPSRPQNMGTPEQE